jgi:hypothetical protein
MRAARRRIYGWVHRRLHEKAYRKRLGAAQAAVIYALNAYSKPMLPVSV